MFRGRRDISLLGISLVAAILFSSGILVGTPDAYAQTPQTTTVVELLPLVGNSTNFDAWFVEGDETNPDTTKVAAVASNDTVHSYISSVVNNDVQGFTIQVSDDLMNQLLLAESITHVKITSISDKVDIGNKATKFSQGLALGLEKYVLPKGGAELNTGFVKYEQTFPFNPFTGGNPNNGPDWTSADIPLLEVLVEQNTDTKQVRVTQVFAEIEFEALPPTISITKPLDDIKWGHTATVNGTASGFGNLGTICVVWGDEVIPVEDCFDALAEWEATHEYAANTISSTETYTVTATLNVLGETPSDTADIDVLAHDTSLIAPTIPADVKWGHAFLVSNTLTDDDAVDGPADLVGKTITYNGTAVASPTDGTSTVTDLPIESKGIGNTGGNKTVIADFAAGDPAYNPFTSPSSTITIIAHDTSLDTPTFSPTDPFEWGLDFSVTTNLNDSDYAGCVNACDEIISGPILYSGDAVANPTTYDSLASGVQLTSAAISGEQPVDVTADLSGDSNYNDPAPISASVNLLKHNTEIQDLEDSAGQTLRPVTVLGTLIDSFTDDGISFKLIDISGNGTSWLNGTETVQMENPLTGGVILRNSTAGGIEVESCGNCSFVGTGSHNKVIFDEGDQVIFDVSVAYATLQVADSQDMEIEVMVNEDYPIILETDIDAAGSYFTYGPNISNLTINSVCKVVDDVTVCDQSIGLVKVIGTSEEGNIHVVNQGLTDIAKSNLVPYSEIAVGGGSFGTGMIGQETTASNLEVTAQFFGDILYNPSDPVTVSYRLDGSLDGDAQLGFGANVNVVADSGVGIAGAICGTDADEDAFCAGWEDNGLPFKQNKKTYRINLNDMSESTPNVMIEIDYMAGHMPNATSLQMIKDVYAREGITLTTFLSDELTHKDTLNVWTDADSDVDNDFNNIKANFYGNSTFRSSATQTNPAGTTLSGTGPYTLTLSGISVTTPADTALVSHSAPAHKTQGWITIKTKVTTENSVTLSVPGTIAKPSTGGGFEWFGTLSVSAIPANGIPGIGDTSHIVTVKVPFRSNGVLNGATLPTILLDITVANPGTITADANTNSPIMFTKLIEAYSQVVRYCIFGHGFGGSSGTAEFLGNDCVVTLGDGFGTDNVSHSRGTMEIQAGTLMHEIGHMQGLKHGGPEIYEDLVGNQVSNNEDDENCKPNYSSIMTYSRQTPAYLGADWILDFSNGTMSPLTENDLDEGDGFLTSGTDGLRNPYHRSDGKIFKPFSTNPLFTPAVPVNFLKNADNAESSVAVDINNFGIPGCDTSSISTDPYHDFDDWDNLKYNFRDTVTGQYDAAAAIFPTTISDINLNFFELAQLQSTTFADPIAVPPPNPDGSTVANGGSTLPIKVPVFMEDGTTPITFAWVYAEYITNGTNTNTSDDLTGRVLDKDGNHVFAYDETGEFYNLGWLVPNEVSGSYWVTVFIGEGDPDDGSLVNIPATPDTCDATILDPNGECPTFLITIAASDTTGGGGNNPPSCSDKPNNPHCIP